MRNRSLSVLLTQNSFVPVTEAYTGAPWSRISSAGFLLTNTGVATSEAGDTCVVSAARASFQLSSLGSFEKLSGSVPAGVHGPSTLGACIQRVSILRNTVLVGGYSNKSQFVF